MEGTRIISALLPVAIALAAEATNADAQAMRTQGLETRFSAQPNLVRVSVENPNWVEIRVYIAVRGGFVPIGTAHRLSSTTFNIPAELLRDRSTLMLLAHPVSESRNTVAARVHLNAAGQATWSITGLSVQHLVRARA